MEVSAYLPIGAIPHILYERPYYIGPNGEEKSYFALAEAMRNENSEGVARWVMRAKEYYGALRERDGYIWCWLRSDTANRWYPRVTSHGP